jgi:cell division protein ZapA (FtsZ GTPase activity inhibitor)
MSKQTVHVRVFDEQYSLVTDEPSEHLERAAELVDSLMRETVQAGFRDKHKVAVLAALQLASKMLHKEFSAQDHKEKYDRIVKWAKSQDKALDNIF